MRHFKTLEDRQTVEAEMSWPDRPKAPTIHRFLSQTAQAHPQRPAISFQLFSAPKAPAETLDWAALLAAVTRLANALHARGIGQEDRVAYVLPNCNEAVISFLAGTVAATIFPINPLLDAEHIAALLRETRTRVVITLRAFPQTDIAQKMAQALADAPEVTDIIEIDLARYLRGVKRLAVPFLRPKTARLENRRYHDFHSLCASQPADRLVFDDPPEDRIAAIFHTGGTTGAPKIAQHRVSGMIYNGWLGGHLLFTEEDVLLCPLPMFHVFAAYPVLMSAIASGAHVIYPTPAGYRGAGVFDNFWKLIERWKVTFLITVPTACSALMQRKVDADISSLRIAISGSAPMPRELYHRFTAATGVEIAEGYGLTEATCLVAVNPPDGVKKIGSIGIAMPYTQVSIRRQEYGDEIACAVDEIGEICVRNPGVAQDACPNGEARHTEDGFLRTGDLGRIDADGYLWITGRAKDLIIRGGHNIDPAVIEEPLARHPAIANAGAIGQPDAFAGELPCVYVELCQGHQVSEAELMAYLREHVHERAAIPKHIEILPELPKTAVGKIFKPELRRRAIQRVLSDVLAEAGLAAHVAEVRQDRRRGLVAHIRTAPECDHAQLRHRLEEFALPYELEGAGVTADPR
ncbi:acyl-CoA synthetase [Thioclava sp. GXIMD4216]|uniref:acyl-CoA synthetase n=1 Tax=Thioclava sp. GXIMD4216 TaxID=3131929 RepID=UPI0030CC892F